MTEAAEESELDAVRSGDGAWGDVVIVFDIWNPFLGRPSKNGVMPAFIMIFGGMLIASVFIVPGNDGLVQSMIQVASVVFGLQLLHPDKLLPITDRICWPPVWQVASQHQRECYWYYRRVFVVCIWGYLKLLHIGTWVHRMLTTVIPKDCDARKSQDQSSCTLILFCKLSFLQLFFGVVGLLLVRRALYRDPTVHQMIKEERARD